MYKVKWTCSKVQQAQELKNVKMSLSISSWKFDYNCTWFKVKKKRRYFSNDIKNVNIFKNF